MPYTKTACKYCKKPLDPRGKKPHERTCPENPEMKGKMKAKPVKPVSTTPLLNKIFKTAPAKAAPKAMPKAKASVTTRDVATREMRGMEGMVDPSILTRIRANRETLEDAYEAFPKDPLMFNVMCYLNAHYENDAEQLVNLKTAMQFIDLKIQTLEGWDDK